jgi:hypothetical protein
MKTTNNIAPRYAVYFTIPSLHPLFGLNILLNTLFLNTFLVVLVLNNERGRR